MIIQMQKASCNNCITKGLITCKYCNIYCEPCAGVGLYLCVGCGKIGGGCLNCMHMCTDCGKNLYCADCVFKCTFCLDNWIGYCCFYHHCCEEILMEDL